MVQQYRRLTRDALATAYGAFRVEIVGSRLAATSPHQPAFFLNFDTPQTQARMRDAIRTSILKKLIPLLEPDRKILDATLGFAQDTREFAQLGIDVFAQERHPLIFALTLDAFLSQLGMPVEEKIDWLSRQNEPWIEIPRRSGIDTGGRICVRFSKDLEACSGIARVAYYDPMFSEESRAALPKKNIQFLLSTVGHDNDQAEVFQDLLAADFSSVVVKRQAGSPAIVPGLRPERQYQSKLVRLDVYRSPREDHLR